MNQSQEEIFGLHAIPRRCSLDPDDYDDPAARLQFDDSQ